MHQEQQRLQLVGSGDLLTLVPRGVGGAPHIPALCEETPTLAVTDNEVRPCGSPPSPLAAKGHGETPVAVALRGLGQVPDPHHQGNLIICHAPIVVAAPGQGQHLAGPALAHAERDLQVVRPGPQLSRLEGFSQHAPQHLLVQAADREATADIDTEAISGELDVGASPTLESVPSVLRGAARFLLLRCAPLAPCVVVVGLFLALLGRRDQT